MHKLFFKDLVNSIVTCIHVNHEIFVHLLSDVLHDFFVYDGFERELIFVILQDFLDDVGDDFGVVHIDQPCR